MSKKQPPPEPGRLVAIIESTEQTFYISQHREHDDMVDDEAIFDVIGRIEEISPRHKRHFGQRINMSFVCSRRFKRDVTEPEGKPLLLSVNLKKDRCSLMAYLPADAFWALPSMISSKTITHVEATFGQSHYGTADLISLYFATARKIGT